MEKEFLDMVNNHRRILYKICNMYGTDKDDRDDLFQEMILQLWRSFSSFRKQSLVSTWMYRVALNTAISQFRKDKRKPERLSLSVAEFQIPDLSITPEEDENRWLLQKAIDQLTRIEKAIVLLYLEEKSYAEISDIMGITTSNVGVKLNRIKMKLEKLIKEKHYEH